MQRNKLFESVLLNPVKQGANILYVVSGYASAAMGLHHLQAILPADDRILIRLIVGMCPQDGLAESNHKAFQQLAGEQYPKNFECSYISSPPSVHSKVYAWYKNDTPVCAFVGSANYSQNAFREKQLEVMQSSDPAECRKYFKSLQGNSVFCTDEDVTDSIRIFSDADYARRRAGTKAGAKGPEGEESARYEGLPSVTVSLLGNNGVLPKISGLNWGQRPRREPNQAYIRLPMPIARSDFFPPRATHFTVLTDDGKTLICTRAQDKAKAIETPHNNSLIGEYFRNRIGAANGQPLTKSDLVRFGRTDVSFFKVDDETYLMDFSPSRS